MVWSNYIVSECFQMAKTISFHGNRSDIASINLVYWATNTSATLKLEGTASRFRSKFKSLGCFALVFARARFRDWLTYLVFGNAILPFFVSNSCSMMSSTIKLADFLGCFIPISFAARVMTSISYKLGYDVPDWQCSPACLIALPSRWMFTLQFSPVPRWLQR